jgi:predicted unusual protein kinase regulating ubiquinone biosynthesis (AarF/ABC1/UbiB family)
MCNLHALPHALLPLTAPHRLTAARLSTRFSIFIIVFKCSPEPIAAASLGQVYKGVLRSTGDEVAVKVQRPGVLETVTVDLFVIRKLGVFMRRFPAITSVSGGA